MKIYGSKQVGRLAYYTDELPVLFDIILYERIKSSDNLELNIKNNKKEHSVSLTRSLLNPPRRKPDKWKYAVIIDGDKLSENVHIEPFSYANKIIDNYKARAVKELKSYDDGSCYLVIKNWPPMKLSRSEFNWIKNKINSLPEEYNTHKKLRYQKGGKRRVNGHYLDEKYLYNNAGGDNGVIFQNLDEIPSVLRMKLTEDIASNEFEERVWMSNKSYLSIKGMILGVIVPKKELSDFETTDDNLVSTIRDALDTVCGSYDIMYY